MKRTFALSCLLLILLAACGRNEVVVQALIADQETGEAQSLANLPVRLLPYDRDAIFDSLEAVYAEPEPAIPADLLQQQQEIQSAEREWRTAEERWTLVRDSLRTLHGELEQMDRQGLRATPQYLQRFRRFEQLENEVSGLETRSQTAFRRYDDLTQAFITRADSVRVVREQWADRAYADFDRVINDFLRRTRREEYADTSNADGVSRFRNIPQGRWWVYARYAQLFEELYWNLPIEVTGDSVGVTLTRENAQIRPAGM
jgi:hypothetical protein